MASFRVDEVVRMVRVVFLHPDLGIGGAERLIVDCSLALQSKVEKSDECSNLFTSNHLRPIFNLALLLQGHETLILTAHHDPSHCFRSATSCDWNVRTLIF